MILYYVILCMYLISTSIDSIPMMFPPWWSIPVFVVFFPQVDVGETTAGTMAAVP